MAKRPGQLGQLKRIAVIGATGLLGRPVTQRLAEAGFELTLLARHSEQARTLFPQASVLHADLRNRASLVAGLQNQDAVYLNLSVLQTEKQSDFHTETDGMANLLAAAREAGVSRIGYLASLVMRYQGMNGFHWWVFDVKHQAVQLIKESGIPYSIYYPSTFMEAFFLQKIGNRVVIGGSSDVTLWMIAAQDYGLQVARDFSFSTHENREYVIQGPEPLTYETAAHRFADHFSRQKLSVLKAPQGMMKFMGLFNRQASYGAHIVEAMNRYPERFEAQNTWDVLGKPTTTLAEFARLS